MLNEMMASLSACRPGSLAREFACRVAGNGRRPRRKSSCERIKLAVPRAHGDIRSTICMGSTSRSPARVRDRKQIDARLDALLAEKCFSLRRRVLTIRKMAWLFFVCDG